VPHREYRGNRKGMCQVKLVPSGARRTIQFDDLNDPRLGSRANPEGEKERGEVGVNCALKCVNEIFLISKSVV
jgi:hypothetical protein